MVTTLPQASISSHHLQYGDHICHIYSSDEEYQHVFMSFILEGLAGGEKVISVLDEQEHAAFLDWFTQADIDLDRYRANGQFHLLSARQIYCPDDTFAPENTLARVRAAIAGAQAEGFPALRFACNAMPELFALTTEQSIIEYEAALNYILPTNPTLTLCGYDRRRLSPDLLLQVLQTHRIVIIEQEYCENFYYMPPEKFLSPARSANTLERRMEMLLEHQHATQGLKESEERYRLLAQHATDVIWTSDIEFHFTYASPSVIDLLGYTPEEVNSLTLNVLVTRSSLLVLTRYLRDALANLQGAGHVEIPSTIEIELIRKDGTTVWTDSSGTILQDSEGNPIGIQGVTRDISLRKQAESSLEEYQSRLEELVAHRTSALETAISQLQAEVTERRAVEIALEKERALLAAAIDILPLPITFVEAGGDVFLRNAASKALRAYVEIRKGNNLIELLGAQTRSTIPFAIRPIGRALQGEVVRGEEFLLAGPDGAPIPILAYAAPIRLEGNIVAAISAYEDITALKEADRAKDEFLAVLSHELQTPLTSMLGWAELALAQNEAQLMRKAMEVIYRNARRQQILVADMLDMSKLIHQKLAIIKEPTDLQAQTRLVVEDLQQEAQQRDITLLLCMLPEPLPIQADPSRLQQCIGNLLQNSLKFSPAGGNVRISCHRNASWAVLSVEDTGRGIAPEHLSELFHLFQQVERDERCGGLGLGLAITQGIVELHGGRVSAASPGIGQGSTFIIELPLDLDNTGS